ncbi:MAG: HAD-IC family P-type ATPase [Ruminococcus sp.]|nr:HAD-IC family P-type ATPase [Ruminococcus sp.]
MKIEKKINGLTSAEVQERVKHGKVNVDQSKPEKTIGSIMIKNIFTLFNLLNLLLAAAVFLVGSYKNMLFMGVVFFNTIIGIVQELRSKKAVDKLTIITGNSTTVLRDGKKQKINNDDIVLDDIIYFERGNQIPADCKVVSGRCYVNESLLTGESKLIKKSAGDKLLSGSFINSGNCYAKTISVGADKYASQLNNSAKYYKKINSEILSTIKRIIKVATIILIPLGIILFINQFFILDGSIESSVVKTVGALIGMIPEGLVLLTSTVLAVSVIRLSKRNVLVQDLYCIETLARVDVLCLDKTGTLTCDEMLVEKVVPFDGVDNEEVMSFLSNFANNSPDYNSTMNAIRDYVGGYEFEKADFIEPFSSEKKCSSVKIGNTVLLCGAGEFILNDEESKYLDEIKAYEENYRVLTFIQIENNERTPICNVLLKDKLRKNAKETLDYFKKQDVTLKIISGDSVNTIVNIAKTFDIDGYKNAVDCSTFKSDEEINEAAEKYTIFGRVTPQQKEMLIKAIHNNGHSVAMTGDGVNDVLALKCADCSVAMASGSEAAKCVSQIVLADNDFSSMPHIVAEGRRTIHNIQRSSSLFLVKNIFSILISVFVIFFGVPYPFQSIQLSFVGGLTIGIPSFILALEYNNKIVQNNFFLNIISGAIPAGLTITLNVLLVTVISPVLGLTSMLSETFCIMVTAFTLFILVVKISIPFNKLRASLVIFISVALTIVFVFLHDIINTAILNFNHFVIFLVLCTVSILLFIIFTVIMNKIKEKIVQTYKN